MGGSALVTGDVSTGSGGGGGAATVDVGSGGVETCGTAAVDDTLDAVCVTWLTALVAVVVTVSAAEPVDGRAAGAPPDSDADVADADVTGPRAPSTIVAPIGCAAPGAGPLPTSIVPPLSKGTAAPVCTAPLVTTKVRPCRSRTTIGPRRTRIAAEIVLVFSAVAAAAGAAAAGLL
jgi:hypothetical protein